jgi:hypothetical protein
MPSTYTFISSNVLSSSAASVTFSAIPATFTDLTVRLSARGDNTGGSRQDVRITFNSDTSSIYSTTRVYGTGTSALSNSGSAEANALILGGSDGADNTADTFSSTEIYVPNYNSTVNKPLSVANVTENNATAAITGAHAHLYRNTSAITSLTITANTANFVSGSSFYLYGIKNS